MNKEEEKTHEEITDILNTGITDINGRKVYEGDVLIVNTTIGRDFSLVPTHFTNLYQVIFENGKFSFGGYTFDNSFIDNIKIVGNIYENPELLEVKK